MIAAQSKQTISPQRAVVGTKIGKCDMCQRINEVLLLSYGFSLCSECLDTCAVILKELGTRQSNAALGSKPAFASSKMNEQEDSTYEIF